MYEAKIIKHSISPGGARIVTFQLTYPMIVHNELMTHRQFSRGSASSRAIPVKKMIKAVEDDPFIPDKWFLNQKGMQPGEEITDSSAIDACNARWLRARDDMLAHAEELSRYYEVTKEIANRLLMPFMWNTVVLTTTFVCNWFNLRCHPMAQRQFRIISEMARDAFFASMPERIHVGGWHLPYIDEQDWTYTYAQLPPDVISELVKVSTGRCARVSYLNQDGVRSLADDVALHDRLKNQFPNPVHAGPFEHPAQALENPYQQSGNFRGWLQYRKTIADECRYTYTHNGHTISDDPDDNHTEGR